MRKLLAVPELKMPIKRGGRAQPGDQKGPVFQHPWQAHAFAIVMNLYENGHYTWPDWDDYLGHEIQSPDHFSDAPKTRIGESQNQHHGSNYNQFMAACEADGENYYNFWLAGLEKMLNVKGMVSTEALESRIRAIAKVEKSGPRFKVDDCVKVLDIELLGHSHLPNYIRGVVGRIECDRGARIFPDSHGHNKTDVLQHVYTLKFQATDIWGEDADARQSLNFSLWDYQLEPVQSPESGFLCD